MATLTTTFKLLRKVGACTERYKFLRSALKGVEDEEPINLLSILETNGLDDAFWALNATSENCDKAARLMAADFAQQVIPIWRKYSETDKRPQKAIKAARDFANGKITREELDAARAAAGDAAGDAARAAWAAAWAPGAAAWAAGAAAWATARAAAGAAAGDAAGDAARAAARAAWAAAKKKQREIFIRHCQPEAL